MRRRILSLMLALPLATLAQTAPLPTVPEGLKAYAVEFRTGPAWQADKPPQEQLHFREHSANLKRLRDAGLLVIGARIAERGFIVLAAKDEAAARAEIDADPSVQAGVFAYSMAPMGVFYGGTLQATPRSSSGKT